MESEEYGPSLLAMRDSMSTSLLHLMCSMGKVWMRLFYFLRMLCNIYFLQHQAAMRMVERGADVTAPCFDGRLPIHFLLEMGLTKIDKKARSNASFDSLVSALVADARHALQKVSFGTLSTFSSVLSLIIVGFSYIFSYILSEFSQKKHFFRFIGSPPLSLKTKTSSKATLSYTTASARVHFASSKR